MPAAGFSMSQVAPTPPAMPSAAAEALAGLDAALAEEAAQHKVMKKNVLIHGLLLSVELLGHPGFEISHHGPFGSLLQFVQPF